MLVTFSSFLPHNAEVSSPAEIPHREHRDLHLLIFRRLENEFVQGLLRAYWDTYEAVGLHHYFDYDYYERIWASHRNMVEAILAGNFEEGKKAMVEHFALLESRLHSTDRGESEVISQKGGPPLTGH